MIDMLVPKPLAKAIGARRQTITVKVRSRGRRRCGPRLHHQEFADRLAFERWRELDTLASRLAMHEQIIDALKHCGNAPNSPVAG